ncbi:MAG: YndJ family transporter, partial [Bdellovibrionota bacterium]|nr:YndJ family transporter [Bdellovibrionota bacterium]
PIFCLIHLIFYFKLGTKSKTTNLIPFFFSFVASTWVVSGTNNYYLLGYDENWSYYAALHGHFLGWIFFGCLAFLEQNSQRFKQFFRNGAFSGVALFLLVALGINGIPILKTIGAIGLCILIPMTVALFCIESKKSMAKILGQITLALVLISMTLAFLKEFALLPHIEFIGARLMVSLHGLINSIFVPILFFFAIRLELKKETAR